MNQYRIGLIAAHSHIDYPRSLRLGVQNTLEEAGHTLVSIADLIPYHTLENAEAYLRVACEIAARLDLDATIVPIGCMTANLSGDNAKAMELLQILDPARTLVLEREVDGFRCVTKDNGPGMHACMRHLIENCGFTKIAFVSGPEASRGAQEREAIYFEEMAAQGLDTPSRFFTRGDFGGDCADVISDLLDNNPDIVAIACACDLIAYTTYSVLHEHKLMVGVDVAVTGFDDNVRSAHMDPPLSTVHMTSYDYGCMAAREALRMCEGLPQEEREITSRFIPRNSCGESDQQRIDYFRELLRQKPFPADEFVSIMMDSTISRAGPSVMKDFRDRMNAFMQKVRVSYLHHLAQPDEDISLFSSQDLSILFQSGYSEYLSLEGFHTVAITLLEALLEESSHEDTSWVVEQISHLHLRIARLLSTTAQTKSLAMDKREWVTFHMVDDALREDKNPKKAYRLILQEFARLGVISADLYTLGEPVEFIGARGFGLSDVIQPLGSVTRGHIEVLSDDKPIVLQELLEHALAPYGPTTMCTVGGVMAGNELLGVAVLKDDALDSHGQLMVLLNLGFALKHLTMIANERDLNELLSRSNLQLAQQSQHDEMTGLLNRRGIKLMLDQAYRTYRGKPATVMYLDLDGLKSINDIQGHDVGDDAICETARILSECMPPEALLARLGGDEFGAFIPFDVVRALNIAERIVEAMDAFNATGESDYLLSISMGWATSVIDDGIASRMPDLLIQADERLYEMKRHRKQARRSSR